MRIAALYDTHGNIPALDAVLAEVHAERVDRIVVGGDVIPGPMPIECLERLFALDIPTECIHGNGERTVLEQLSGIDTTRVPPAVLASIRWVASQIPPGVAKTLATWPATWRVSHPAHGDILFCHATPRNDTEIFTRRTPENVLQPMFDAAHAQIVVCGHTHMQFDRHVGATRVMNAGSVGMPFGEPSAYWLLIDDERCALRRTSYDFVAAARLIGDTAYPGAATFATNGVLSPPNEETILQAWAGAEIR